MIRKLCSSTTHGERRSRSWLLTAGGSRWPARLAAGRRRGPVTGGVTGAVTVEGAGGVYSVSSYKEHLSMHCCSTSLSCPAAGCHVSMLHERNCASRHTPASFFKIRKFGFFSKILILKRMGKLFWRARGVIPSPASRWLLSLSWASTPPRPWRRQLNVEGCAAQGGRLSRLAAAE